MRFVILLATPVLTLPGFAKEPLPVIDMHTHAYTADVQGPPPRDQQKRDILYNNAARFLRLSDAEIARHHGM
jgi:hypothetical protein